MNNNAVPSQELKTGEAVSTDLKSDNQNPGTEGDTFETQAEDNDYKAELEALKAQNEKLARDNENYKKGLIKAKQKIKEFKGENNEEEEENEEEELLDKLDERMRQREEQREIEFRRDFINEAINAISSNSDEAELIKHHYDKTINKSGYTQSLILEDIKRAKLLANEKRILRDNAELSESLARKSLITTAPHFSSEKRQESKKSFSDYGFSSDDIQAIQRVNASRVKRGLKPLTPEEIIKK
jgi:hypothetical protein